MWKWAIAGLSAMAALIAAISYWPAARRAATWQRLYSPGPLSSAHAFLRNDCAACHTAVSGVSRAKCVACHADDSAVLERQPSAFHATIGDCAPCHYEHISGVTRPIAMNHAALAGIGLAQLRRFGNETRETRARLVRWMRDARADVAPRLSPEERLLDCVSCHEVNDVHSGNFGRDCARCHDTGSWFIEAYVHPSAASTDCAQCHRASPCHYMEGCLSMMGHMAGGEGARLEQCYQCHKTTSWYDFKRPMSSHH